jgi:hypothetical protein
MIWLFVACLVVAVSWVASPPEGGENVTAPAQIWRFL